MGQGLFDLSGRRALITGSSQGIGLALARGLADEVSAQKFLFERMYPYEGLLTEEESYWSTQLCVLELLHNGVTTFIDAGNYFPEVTAKVVGQAGVRCALARSAIGASPVTASANM